MLLAAAGLLPGLEATTHWRTTDELAALGAVPVGQRVVEHLDKRIITGAGVSAGIDMALRLAELLTDHVTAKAMQLMIEYDPQPPFAAGNLAGAGNEVLTAVIELSKLKN
jgi:transcriptional regulator GlxA family with amidase domain